MDFDEFFKPFFIVPLRPVVLLRITFLTYRLLKVKDYFFVCTTTINLNMKNAK